MARDVSANYLMQGRVPVGGPSDGTPLWPRASPAPSRRSAERLGNGVANRVESGMEYGEAAGRRKCLLILECRTNASPGIDIYNAPSFLYRSVMQTSGSPPAAARPEDSSLIVMLVAAAFFMENLDGTIIADRAAANGRTRSTCIPSTSASASRPYLLIARVFIPISGWGRRPLRRAQTCSPPRLPSSPRRRSRAA